MRGLVGFLDDLSRFPAIGKLLAWFVWISVDSPTTTALGLVLIGLGLFLSWERHGTGTIKSPDGFEVSGNMGPMLLGLGVFVYLVGGGYFADPRPQPTSPLEQLGGRPNA